MKGFRQRIQHLVDFKDVSRKIGEKAGVQEFRSIDGGSEREDQRVHAAKAGCAGLCVSLREWCFSETARPAEREFLQDLHARYPVPRFSETARSPFASCF
jgi:hypothetical protein